MYRVVLCLKYLLRRRLTILSTVGVLLGVGTLVVVLAVMNGFVKEVREASRGGLSDVIIESDIAGFAYYDELAELLREHPNVEHATPVIQFFGLAHIAADPTTPYPGATTTRVCLILGIKPEEFSQVSRFSEYMVRQPSGGEAGNTGEASGGTGGKVQDFEIDDEMLLKIYRRQERITSRRTDDEVLLLFSSMQGLDEGLPRAELLSRMRQYLQKRYDEVLEEWLDEPLPAGCVPGLSLVSYDAPEVARQVDPNAGGEPILLMGRGSRITLTTIPVTSAGGLSGVWGTVSAQTAEFTIVNHFKSRLYEFDRQNIYIPFEEAQRLGRLGAAPIKIDGVERMRPAHAHQLLVKLKDYSQASESIADFRRIYDELRPGDRFKHNYMTFSTWEQKQAMILSVVTMQRNLMVILLGLIILVAGFMIGATLSMIVKEKTRDIGILKSLGGSDSGVASIFLLYGFTIGTVGSTLGLAAGLVFVDHIDLLAEKLSDFLGYSVFPAAAYGFDRIPRDVNPLANGTIVAGAILVAVLCSVVAAWRASRMQPVEALRYE